RTRGRPPPERPWPARAAVRRPRGTFPSSRCPCASAHRIQSRALVSTTQGDGPRGREVWLLVLGSVALAVIATWPLAIHPGQRIAQNLADPIRTAWQV